MSASEYLLKFKNLTDAGHVISEVDQKMYILAELGT